MHLSSLEQKYIRWMIRLYERDVHLASHSASTSTRRARHVAVHLTLPTPLVENAAERQQEKNRYQKLGEHSRTLSLICLSVHHRGADKKTNLNHPCHRF